MHFLHNACSEKKLYITAISIVFYTHVMLYDSHYMYSSLVTAKSLVSQVTSKSMHTALYIPYIVADIARNDFEILPPLSCIQTPSKTTRKRLQAIGVKAIVNISSERWRGEESRGSKIHLK